MLILFALPLALSPLRPTLKEEDDFNFIESPLLDDGLGGGFCADVAPAVDGLAVTIFRGLFWPVLLVVAAEVGAVDGLASLLMRCEGMVGSEGNLDIKGGLGGRAEVNLGAGSDLPVDRGALVFFLRAVGDVFGDSFFSSTGDSWSLLLPLDDGILSLVLRLFIPDLDFFEAEGVGSVGFRVAEGLFGAREVLADFLVVEGDLLFFPAAVAAAAVTDGEEAESFCLGAVCSRGEVGISSCSPSMS